MAYEAIVVGAGIEGSAAAYQLAKRGVKVLLLEQFDACHTRGGSHGQSRIIRRAYEKPYYVQMMNDAYTLWSDLEIESGVTLYKPTGLLLFGVPDAQLLLESIQCLEVNGIPHEVFGGEEANRRFSILKLPAEFKCVYDKDGGILLASKALTAFQQGVVRHGGVFLDNHQVKEITPAGSVVSVVTSQQTFQTKKLVIATGGWAPSMCRPLGIHLPFKVTPVQAHYYSVENSSLLSNVPAFALYEKGGRLATAYGMPETSDLMKFGSPDSVEFDFDIHSDKPPDLDTSPIIAKFIESTFNGVSKIPVRTDNCIITISPDTGPVIDKHPNHGNIIIAAGFSGHGFKLSPVVGKMVAELVMEETPSFDLSPFRLDRFQQ